MAERAHQIELRRGGPGYAEDYGAWVEYQLDLLRRGRLAELDVENLIEEVADLGKSEFKAFVSAIEIVIIHMLKWDLQPQMRSLSWQSSIGEHRTRIAIELEDSPSYGARVDEAMTRAFRVARQKAAREMGRRLRDMPVTNPYDWAAITTRDHPLPGDDA